MTDRSILITGGSSGIGAAVAVMAAKRGYARVILTYAHNPDKAEAVANAVRAHGADAEIFKTDVADPQSIATLFASVRALSPLPLDLVNNAGIVDQKASIADLTPQRVQNIFAINVLGAFEVARQAVAYMRDHMGGGIVNITSTAARKGMANEYIDYAATKAAIDTFTIGLADELAPEGIRVNAVRPGLIDTEIHAKGGIPDRLEQFAHTTPMGRAGTADEVAEAVLWLLSDQASYTTRTTIDVAGGR